MSEIIAIAIGVLFGGAGAFFFVRRKPKNDVSQTADVLLERVKSVCKLITVEGDFSEIYHHQEKQGVFFNLFTDEKKAIVMVKAKVQVGYDLGKMVFEVDKTKKKILLKEFPEAEVLSKETDMNYYDVKNGLFVRFSPEDFTKLQEEAKRFITQKVKESTLPELAQKQAQETFLLLEKTTEGAGWKLHTTLPRLGV